MTGRHRKPTFWEGFWERAFLPLVGVLVVALIFCLVYLIGNMF